MIFTAVTSRTGWTPQQIAQLTLGQLGAYLSHWVGKPAAKKESQGLDDLDMFNIMAGIPKVVRKK